MVPARLRASRARQEGAMRFRRNAPLDTGQVTDARGSAGSARAGSPSAAAGSASSALVDLVPDLAAFGRRQRLGQLGRSTTSRSASGGTRRASSSDSDCRTGAGREQAPGLPHRRRREQRAEVLGRRRSSAATGSTVRDTVFFTGQTRPVRLATSAGRAVLLPGGQARLHRPRLLRRARVAVRRRRQRRSSRRT